MNRRDFLHKTFSVSVGLGIMNNQFDVLAENLQFAKDGVYDERSYLKEILYTKKEVDLWLEGKAFPFSKYHPEYGWLLNNGYFRDGIDKSNSVYTYESPDGPRITGNYREKPCRINTYGDSFTQCHQVSDHETWQEIIAGHIQEPVRNFGIGAWSVYQAYLRMLNEEKRSPAEYIILNIFEDDHKRNLDSWRNIRVKKHPKHIESTLPYLKVNQKTNEIIECVNPCPTPESLYQLCDLETAYNLFKDDFVLKIMVAHKNAKLLKEDSNYSQLDELVKTHGIKTNLDDYKTVSEKAEAIHLQTAISSTMKIVENMEAYGKDHNKKILYVLSYPGKSIARYINEGYRSDAAFIEFIKTKKLPHVDLMEAHSADFNEHRLHIKDYLKKYFIGHYTPLGNFFCADKVKDTLIKMLNPKPLPYLRS